jgi:hypothetical protein
MHTKRNRLKPAALALLSVTCAAYSAHAQTADALIDKLVDKGILTVKEAKDLRDEADKGFTTAHQAKTGMPDWVTALKINGDFRGRYDGVYNPDPFPTAPALFDRHRFRYRLRAGITANLRDDMEVGFRLTSSEAVNSTTSVATPSGGTANAITGMQGGDPISGNSSFSDNGSKKFVYIDLAYAKWKFVNVPQFNLQATVGKMEIGKVDSSLNPDLPFVFSEMVFDGDYTPEGAALTLAYEINDAHALRVHGGGFMLDEISGDSNDPYVLAAQLRHDAKWTKEISTSAGVAVLAISNEKALNNSNVPNIQGGNTRTSGGQLVENFTTLVGDLSATYTFETGPMYNAPFPIKVGAEYLRNTAADAANEGYAFGITIGKSGKKGLWDVSYKYKELQGDVWYEEMVDSDFGAVYQFANVGGSAGYRAGTNLRGHVIRANYSLFDSFTIGATAYLANVINSTGPAAGDEGYDSDTLRVQVDAVWKF